MKRIAVIGAHGFIGTRLCEKMAHAGHSVVAISPHQFHWRHLVHQNIDYHVTRSFSETLQQIDSVDVIINAAAYGAYPQQTDPDRMWHANVEWVRHLLDWLRERPHIQMIQFGSSSEYGEASENATEDQQLTPNSDYGVSKAQATELCRQTRLKENLKVTVLRLYSVYGPWEDPHRLIPTAVSCEKLGLADPGITRDFVYVDDVVEAVVKVILLEGECSPVINIGSGRPCSLKELAEVLDKPWESDSSLQRSWDHGHLWYGDIQRAREELEWSPRTSFSKGLENTKHFLNRYSPQVTGSGKLVAVIAACYKTAESLEELYRRTARAMEGTSYRWFFVLVDDACPDKSEFREIESLSKEYPNVLGIRLDQNMGSQNAFLTGIRAVQGVDAVVLMDADLQDPPELIPKMLERWESGPSELVLAMRPKREESRWMAALRRAFYMILKTTSPMNLVENSGDFGVYDKKTYMHMLTEARPRSFLRCLRMFKGVSVQTIEYVRPDRKHGRSTNNWRQLVYWVALALIRSSSWLPKAVCLVVAVGVLINPSLWPLLAIPILWLGFCVQILWGDRKLPALGRLKVQALSGSVKLS